MKKIVLICLLFAGAMPSAAGEVNVAVAANFTDAMRDIVPLFEKATGNSVKVSFGSTGKLYSQIENGAPFEVFLAADTKRPQKAEAAGLAVPGSRFTYALGRLYLWSAKAGEWHGGEAWLKQAKFNHLAIANPQTAPYGLAAQQVMEHLAMWEEVQPKLVQGDSIAQTFQFAVSGNADAAFVAGSQAKAWKKGGSSWEVPQTYYQPIEQQAVLLTKGTDSEAARAFIAFLHSDAARAVIRGYGYGVAE